MKIHVKYLELKKRVLLKRSFDADLTIVDMNKEQIIKDEMIASKCGWTPFNNYKVKRISYCDNCENCRNGKW